MPDLDDLDDATQKKFEAWAKNNSEHTKRLKQLLLPKFLEQKDRILAVISAVDKIAIPGKDPLRSEREILKGCMEDLPTGGLGDVFNECARVFQFYQELHNGDAAMQAQGNNMLIAVRGIMSGVREYQRENHISQKYGKAEFRAEGKLAKATFGSDMVGIDHIWCKGIIARYITCVMPERIR